MPYHHGHAMATHMPRANRLPLTPPDFWGHTNPQQQYGAIGQAYYPSSQDSYSAKRATQYDFDFPPVTAPVYGQYRGYEQQYETQIPTLPPIRTYDLDRPQEIIQPVQEPKEEKVAGGVASTLTYKMEHMIDFVSEMTSAMYELYRTEQHFAGIDIPLTLQARSQGRRFEVTPSYRKYVSQVLTSTRLPISTLMLALNYMAERIELLQEPSYTPRLEVSLIQMLTTSLMLASKFLDDNTFQNRSWAEVSQTAVKELNKHELAWLEDMGWHLQFDVNAQFKTWSQCFERAVEARKARSMQSSMEGLKLSHGEVQRHSVAPRYSPQTPLYTPPSHYEANFSQARDRPNPWQQWNPPRNMSPPSAGPSYPSTPGEWFRIPSAGFGQHSMAYSTRPLPPLQILPSSQSPFYGAGNYSQYPPVWSAHHNGCPCCQRPSDYGRHSMYHAYGVQSAA